MSEIEPRTFKGTRDFLPEDMHIRETILATMKSVFTRYGFAPLETPAFEFLDVLTGKYGDEADKLLYTLAYKGGKELALRYDLTVPLARVIAMNPHLPKPFKRYQIQPVWRADSPQLKRGRYREFYQCDVDTVGSPEPISDAEIIALMVDVFDALNFLNFEVRLNSRKILRGMIIGSGLSGKEIELDICRYIDKLEKEGLENVQRELLKKGYPADNIEKICSLLRRRILGNAGIELLEDAVAGSDVLDEGLAHLRTILTLLKEMEVPENKVVFDFTLARGLDYYTGPIFEVVFPNRPEVGSVAGGGRYDDLVGLFMRESIPAVGTSFGLERIHTLIKSRQEQRQYTHHDIDFLVCYFDEETRQESLKRVNEIRSAGMRCEMYIRPDKIKKQFSYADKKNIPFVILFGPDEKKNETINIKDMTTGKQNSYQLKGWIRKAQNLVNLNNPG